MKKTTIVLALLLTCGVAQASEWVSLGKNENKAIEVFVDVSRLHRSGEIMRAWVKYVFVPHMTRGDADDSSKWKDNTVQRYAFNCSEGSGKQESVTIYFEDGSLWSPSAEFMATQRAWEPIAPDTVGETVMKFVCAWKPK